MARRRAISMAGAAGDELAVNQVLHRFGFDAADLAPTISDALLRVRQQSYDLLIIAADQLDPSQMTALERELRRDSRLSVIATAPRADSDLILKALRTGIHEFLVRPVSPGDLNAAVERITRRVPSSGKRGAVLAVYSAKGGVGVSTIALNLAFQLGSTRSETRVALADLVVGLGDIRMLLNLKSTYDINDLVARQERVDADVLFSLLTQRLGVWVLPSSDKADTVDLDSVATTSIVAQLRAHFGITVLDCEHHLNDHTIAALDAADRILLVTQLTIPVLRGAQRTLQLFNRLGYPDEKVMVLVNRLHSADTVSMEEAAAVLQRPVELTLINDFASCSKAVTRGAPLVETARSTALAADYGRLASRITDSIGEDEVEPAARASAARARIALVGGR
ncbi:MAG TPA: AAA family ATPase [Gemmatimonadaceae bacterium]